MNTEPNISKSVFIPNSNSLALSVPYQEEEKNNQFNTAQNLREVSYTLKEGEYIDNGVKVIKLLFETEHSKFYLANIEEINENILIKTISYEVDDGKSEELLLKLSQEINKVYQLLNDNILLYYDYIQLEEEQKALIFMENIPNCQSLLVYCHNYNKYNKKPKGLKLNIIKHIIKSILLGLNYLHENNITHTQLCPKNILIDNDLKIVKISNHAMRTNSFDVTTFPYYSSPELCFNKTISTKTDIWSVGCILFELFTGYQPYGVMKSIDPLFTILQCISPIEAADDDVKDFIYDRKNRIVLDFMNKCFRPIESTRPSADELLGHKLFQ